MPIIDPQNVDLDDDEYCCKESPPEGIRNQLTDIPLDDDPYDRMRFVQEARKCYQKMHDFTSDPVRKNKFIAGQEFPDCILEYAKGLEQANENQAEMILTMGRITLARQAADKIT